MEHEDLRQLVRAVLSEKAGPSSGRAARTEISWTPWSKKARTLPFKSTKKGIGNGEARLAAELRGTVQGQNVSYDVVDAEGRRWEVKEPGATKELRIEQEGTLKVLGVLQTIRTITNRLVKLFSSKQTGSAYYIEPFFNEKERSDSKIAGSANLDYIRSFLSENAVNMLRGEITYNRLMAFKDVLNRISSVLNREEYYRRGNRKAEYAFYDKANEYVGNMKMTPIAAAEMAAKLQLKVALQSGQKEMDLDDSDWVHNLFFKGLSKTSSLAFVDPERFIQKIWHDAIRPSELFGDVDGVVLVNDAGYRVLTRDILDKELYFKRISRSKPMLGVGQQPNSNDIVIPLSDKEDIVYSLENAAE